MGARSRTSDPAPAEPPAWSLVKTSGADEQAALVDQDPELYYLPKFYAPSGWIAIRLDTGRTDWEHIADWLARSWRSVAPKRLTKMMDIAAEF